MSGRRLDELLGDGWAVVARAEVPTPAGVPLVRCPEATYGFESVLVRPDRYIAGVAGPEGFTALRSRDHGPTGLTTGSAPA